MKSAETRLELMGIGPQGGEAGVKPPVEREVVRIAKTPGSTPFRPCGVRSSLDSFKQKIIGHRIAVRGSGIGRGPVRRGLNLAGVNRWLSLLDQPPTEIPGKRYPPGIKRTGEDRRHEGVCFVRMGRRGCWWRGGRSGRNAGAATRTATLIHAVG